MARRRLTIKRIDPWSVLKFGAVVNIVLLAIFLLVAGIVWYIVDRLALVDQACGIATDVGFTSCGVDTGNLFQALLLLGALWAVVQTAVMVFFAFLHNLIADLTGGLVLGVVEDGVASGAQTPRTVTTASTPPTSGRTRPAGDRADRTAEQATDAARGQSEPRPTGEPRGRRSDPAQTGSGTVGAGRSGRRRTSDEQLFDDGR